MNKKIIQNWESDPEIQRKIAAMRKGGKILGGLMRDLKEYVKPGMTGLEIDLSLIHI